MDQSKGAAEGLYTRAALRHGLAHVETLRARLAATPVADDKRAWIAACIMPTQPAERRELGTQPQENVPR